MTDADLAALLARTAGQLLMTLRESGTASGKTLGNIGDATANSYLVHALHALRPDDGLLSEERVDDLARLEKSRVWIIDPLDGTREYSEGREDWAVHVALSIDGHAAVGAVALPAQGLVLRSDRPAPQAQRPERPRLLVSRTRPPPECTLLQERLGAEMVPMGSAGAKAMAVVLGQGDIYFHTGGQHQWDNAAPVAVALGAGMVATRVDGSPCRYNARETLLPDLLICAPEWEAPVRAALAE
ncbi:3'(2'),5'-bisphosphate nucleotidase CysQ [Sphingomonas sp. ID1715]|uniref:3'(2'),5'-bisphosphate nucleotidase CysQ n=1 Tax=Sphingomonas sp. ID1715 TaxID=1656898 RepID=UPI001488EA58|nr:3'(2'),5'-bisphosphate nucleotidase CysQ [Sphingomonas sp. ID1715]NNM78704.1 3'(2'),5'-bisphosphate nucleotidase CysQ [Sphingomonas sp. ID1715]